MQMEKRKRRGRSNGKRIIDCKRFKAVGASIDLDWKDGRATRAVVTALVPGKFTVKMPASAVRAEVTVGGHTYTYKKPAFSLDLNKGEEATVCFF